MAASGDSEDKSEAGEEEEGQGSEPRTPSPAERRRGSDKDDDDDEDRLKKGLKSFLHDKEENKPEVSRCGHLDPLCKEKCLGMWCAVCFCCTSGRGANHAVF